jgi:hypothetical protein
MNKPGGSTRESRLISHISPKTSEIWGTHKCGWVRVLRAVHFTLNLPSGKSFARDDNSVAGVGHYSVPSIPATTELSSRPERSAVEGPAVSAAARRGGARGSLKGAVREALPDETLDLAQTELLTSAGRKPNPGQGRMGDHPSGTAARPLIRITDGIWRTETCQRN